ncbi:hypothetical protein FKM82_030085 [Ascaphus truei]
MRGVDPLVSVHAPLRAPHAGTNPPAPVDERGAHSAPEGRPHRGSWGPPTALAPPQGTLYRLHRLVGQAEGSLRGAGPHRARGRFMGSFSRQDSTAQLKRHPSIKRSARQQHRMRVLIEH